MRCIVVGTYMENEDILYDIGEYFWNAGKEVYIRNFDFQNLNAPIEMDIIVNSDIIVLVKTENNTHVKLKYSTYFKTFFDSFFVHKVDEFIEHLEVLNPTNQVNLPNYKDKPVILFCNNGVYSSDIPYPNKLYHCTDINKENFDDFIKKINHLKAFCLE